MVLPLRGAEPPGPPLATPMSGHNTVMLALQSTVTDNTYQRSHRSLPSHEKKTFMLTYSLH